MQPGLSLNKVLPSLLQQYTSITRIYTKYPYHQAGLQFKGLNAIFEEKT